MHIWFAAVFLLTSIFHIYLNWWPLLAYFKNRLTKRVGFRFEWVVALVICFLIVAGTLTEQTPFVSLLALNDKIKNSWDKREQQAPIPHAELLTLRELADEAKLDLDDLLSRLKSKGMQDASAESIVGDLAKTHGMPPNTLFDLASGKPSRHGQGRAGGGQGRGMGGGPGRKTLRAVCQEEGIDLNTVLERLRGKGIEAKPDEILRDIAFSNEIRPPQLLEMIRQQ